MLNKNKSIFIRKLSFGVAFAFLGTLTYQSLFPAVPSNAATEATAITDLELEVEPTIEVAVDTQTLNLAYNGETDILPTSEGVTATGDVNVYVTTNGISGYILSLYSQSATNDMTNTNTAISNKISATEGGLSELSANTWGFQYNGSSWTAVSDDSENPSVLISNGTTSSSLCDNLAVNYASCYPTSADKATVTFGAKITDSLPSGKYTNDVVFSAVAKSPAAKHAYKIAYDKNNTEATGAVADAAAILPGTVPALSDGAGFTYEGMRVAGWALTPGATEVAEVGGTALTPGVTNIDISALISAAAAAGQDVSEDKNGTITLYAVWEIATKYMQTFSCASLVDGESDTLVDSRDGNEYTVKKFGTGTDAECWMTSNLTLGYDQTAGVAKGLALTSADTNIPASDSTTYYLPRAGYMGSLSSSSTMTSTTTANFNSSNETYAKVQYAAASSTGSTNPQPTGYYNFWAASLGYSGYEQGSSSGNTPRDICPKGWQLPVNDSSSHKSWYYFYNTLNGGSHSNLISSTGAALPYSGYYGNSSLDGVGSNGYWWSSTVYNTYYSYNLYVYSGGYVYPQYNSYKYRGFAVRCVAQ